MITFASHNYSSEVNKQKQGKHMKKIITTLIALMAVINISAQSVYCAIDVNTINKKVGYTDCIPLDEESGHVIIPNTLYKNKGSLGLLVIHHTATDEYYAFDLRCPDCASHGKSAKIMMETCILCKCSKCPSEYQNVCLGVGQQTNYTEKYYLKTYNVYPRGDKLIITDKIMRDDDY